MLGGTARVGIEAGVRKGDFARRLGLPGAGVLKPVAILDPLPLGCRTRWSANEC
jgi:hypothetical protein